MDNRKKYGDEAVDEILAQLKKNKQEIPQAVRPANTDENTKKSVDELLASMGITQISAPPEQLIAKVEEVAVRKANAAFEEADTLEIGVEDEDGAQAGHSRPRENDFVQQAEPQPEPQQAQQVNKPDEGYYSEPVYKEQPQPEYAQKADYALGPEYDPEPQKVEKPVKKTPAKGAGQTTILDIQLPENGFGAEQITRVGKAAALDKVEADKYANDEEFLGWFPGGNELYATKKEQKKAEKEFRKQEAAARKEAAAARAAARKEDAAGRKNNRRYRNTGNDEDLTEETQQDAWQGEEEELSAIYAAGRKASGYKKERDEVYEEAYAEQDYAKSTNEEDDFAGQNSYEEPEANNVSYGSYEEAAAEQYDDAPVMDEGEEAADPWEAVADAQAERTLGFSVLEAEESTVSFNVPGNGAEISGETAVPETAVKESTLGFAAENAEAFDDAPQSGNTYGNMPEAATQPPEAPTLGFSSMGSEADSAAPEFKNEQPYTTPQDMGAGHDTQSYDIEPADIDGRVPTAVFTQEFEPGEAPPPVSDPNGTRSLYINDMVNDSKFDDFFKESVAVGSLDDERQAARDEKARKRRKKSRSAIITGEFAKLAGMLEQAEDDELASDEDFEDYNHLQQAGEIESDILALGKNLVRRTVVTAIIGVLLLWLGSAFQGGLPVPEFLNYQTSPVVFSIVYLVLVLAAVAINFTTFISGLVGLVSEPTVDAPPALAALAAILQSVVLLVQSILQQPVDATLFGGLMALMLAFNAFGKRVRATSILRNFRLASAGYDHSAAYVLDNSTELAYSITDGLEEEDPTLLISRPTALVKGFLRQSFSQRATDRTGRVMGWVLLGFALLAAALTFAFFKDAFLAVSAFAGLLCIGAPFSSTMVSAVPSSLMQKSTARLGAVVPGWSAIEELGQVNVVMATAKDIFPPSSVYLKGIKTFEKERIDLAILYAASVLVEGCDTLRDIFLGVIQGKSDMLYKVESLTKEPGRGFTAWVENSRVVIGNREMLQKHAITPPPVEIEMKFVPEGYFPVYLAVSGKLFAMFIVGYGASPEVSSTLNGLVKSGVSLLVTSDDMNVTGELVERIYGLPPGVVKVLGWREIEMLEPMTAYKPESEGVMTHIGTFTSFIGGMRAAAACAAAEKMSSIVQIASVALATLLCIMLMFMGGQLATLSISIAIMYQIGWTVLVSVLPFAKKY